jgi:NAD(P)H-nitrite reductase large subunit
MKVYVLIESSGQYEDYYQRIVKIFESMEQAEIEKQILEDKNEEDRNKFDENEDFMFEEYWYDIKEQELMTKPKYTR